MPTPSALTVAPATIDAPVAAAPSLFSDFGFSVTPSDFSATSSSCRSVPFTAVGRIAATSAAVTLAAVTSAFGFAVAPVAAAASFTF